MIHWKTQKKLVLMCAYYIVMHRYADYAGMKQSPDARRLYALMRRLEKYISAGQAYYIRAEYWQPMRYSPEDAEAYDKANEILRDYAYY